MPVVAVTGANGFIGKNVMVRLHEAGITAKAIAHGLDPAAYAELLSGTDLLIHLAGVNRPIRDVEFSVGNVSMTEAIIAALEIIGRPIPVLYASTIHATADTPYGRSKFAAERALRSYGARAGASVAIARLPGVFGKWCRPNYNSVVATFCHNIARGLPITVNDPSSPLNLVYIDDVVSQFVEFVEDPPAAVEDLAVSPVYQITLGELSAQIQRFHESRSTYLTDRVGTGLLRALHATYLSYLPPQQFSYPLKNNTDQRGSFAEVLRTQDSGQFSVFTAHPGITRGGHYHHSKTEKFLVVQGRARFGFRQISSGETFVIETDGDTPQIVETVPGWAHDVTNIGDGTLVVMLWANELFDRDRPDTFAAKVLAS